MKWSCPESGPMKKVIVIGSPGAGKSTFARRLRDLTGLPLYYLDMIWHKADGTNVSREEFDKALEEILQKDCWIIDGNYQRTLEMRLRECSTVFLLDYPLELCLSGAEKRIGKVREDLPWVETTFDESFRQWILDFPREHLPQIYDLLGKYSGHKNVMIFKAQEEAEGYLMELAEGTDHPKVVIGRCESGERPCFFSADTV